jgi:glycosyltransferase involved in cell wall biosynthesis
VKKVGLILTPVEFGGAEKVSLLLIKNINGELFDLRPVLLIRPWEEKSFFLREIAEEGCDYTTIPVALHEKAKKKDYWRVLRCLGLFLSIARSEHFDLIHTNGYFADIIGIPVSRILGIPTMATCHGFINNDAKLRFYNKLDLFALRFSNRILCVSGELKDLLIRSGVSSLRVRELRNAIEVERDQVYFQAMRQKTRHFFGVREDEILLGFCGRLSKEKGIQHLVEAGSTLLMMGLPIKILLIGDGPERPKIESLITASDLRNRCILNGFSEKVLDLLPAIDVFVLPSLTEGMPMALLEAMGQGIPVVASAVGEIPAVVRQNENGILVKPGRSEEIVSAVRRIIENRKLRERLSNKAFETISNQFGLKPWVQEIEKHYSELINQANR